MDERGRELARVSNHDHLRNEPARLDEAFYFLRRDVLSAAGFDQVFFAVCDGKESVFVNVAYVARSKPALFIKGFAIGILSVVVALHYRVAFNQYLAVFGYLHAYAIHDGADRAD